MGKFVPVVQTCTDIVETITGVLFLLLTLVCVAQYVRVKKYEAKNKRPLTAKKVFYFTVFLTTFGKLFALCLLLISRISRLFLSLVVCALCCADSSALSLSMRPVCD
jgi:hypothetical protein